MSIVVLGEAHAADWADGLRSALPDVEVHRWPDLPDASRVEMALVRHDLEPLASLPNLRAVAVLAAGVEHLFEQRDAIPRGVTVVRQVDPSITAQMVEWVLLALFAHTRRWDEYAEQQRQRSYEELPVRVPVDVTIGILGIGALGEGVANALGLIGFPVRGWSRSPRDITGVDCFAGREGLAPFLRSCDVVVCLLPVTPDTTRLLNRELFAMMKPGAYLINGARGALVDESDLLRAIDSGHLSGATLDTQVEEPMPPDHRFWTHPAIRITPHIAAYTMARFCVPQVAENYRRLQAGQPLINVVDLDQQY